MANDGTVKIGVKFDDKEIEKSFKELQKSTEKTFSELEKLDDALKLDPKNIELLTEKQKLLSNAVDDSKKKVEILSKEMEKAKSSGLKDKDADAYRNLAVALSKAESEAKGFESQLKDVSKQISNGGQSADEFSSKLKKLGDTASSALKTAASVIGGVATAAAGAVGGLLAVEAATEEYRIAQGKLNTAFEAAGYGTDVAAEAYSRFYGILGDTDTATEASQLLAKLAQSEEDVATWADIAAGVSGTFGDALPIEGLIEASNETAKVGQVTGVLADALNWAGISEDEFNEKLAACTSESERNQLIMDTLAGTYDEASDAFYRNNEELVKARENQVALDNAMSNIGEAVSSVKNEFVSKFTPAIEDASEKVAEFISGIDVDQVVSSIQELIETLVALSPALAAAAAAFVAFKVATAISSAISAVTTALQGMTIAQAALNAVMAVNPFVLIATAVAALVAGIIVLWNTNEGFRDAVISIWEAIKGAFIGAWEAIEAVWSTVADFFTAIWNGIVEELSPITEAIGGAFSAAWSLIQTVWSLAQPFFSNIWEGIKAVFSVVSNVLGGFFSSAWNAIKSVWEAVKPYFEQLWEGIKAVFSVVSDVLGGFFSAAWEAIKGVWNAATGYFENVWKTIEGIFSVVESVLKGDFEGAWEAIKGVLSGWGDYFRGLYDTLVNVFSNVWDAFSSIGSNIVDGIKSGISNAWGSLTSWVSDKFNALVSSVKSGLGIASPSKVFAKIGRFMAEGVGVGWGDEFSDIQKDINKSLDFSAAIQKSIPIVRSVASSMVPRGVFGGQNVTNNTNSSTVFYINVSGASNREEARNIGREIGAEAQREMRRRGLVMA